MALKVKRNQDRIDVNTDQADLNNQTVKNGRSWWRRGGGIWTRFRRLFSCSCFKKRRSESLPRQKSQKLATRLSDSSFRDSDRTIKRVGSIHLTKAELSHSTPVTKSKSHSPILVTAPTPSQPTPTKVDPFSFKTEKILRKCFKHNQGAVVGENHTDASSTRFLMDHLHLFEQLGVKYFFLEIKKENHEKALNHFYSSKNASLSQSEEIRLLDIEAKNRVKEHFNLGSYEFNRLLPQCRQYIKDHKYSYPKLLIEAKRHGITVIPIDSKAYARSALKKNGKQRLREMNTYAEQVINDTVGKNEKYVVHVGVAHTLQYKQKSEIGLGPRLFIPVIHAYESKFEDDAVFKNYSYQGFDSTYKPDFYIRYGYKNGVN